MFSPLRAVALLFLLLSGSAFAAAPILANAAATPGVNGTAKLSVDVTAGGQSTTVTFSYGLTNAYGTNQIVVVPAGAVAQTTSVNITGLTRGQTYHFQVTATNADGAAVPTPDQAFVEPLAIPVTGAATTVGSTAKLNGKITTGANPGKAYFEYGTTTAYGTSTPLRQINANVVEQAIQETIMGLTRNTTYHFRLNFLDDVTLQTVSGSDVQFVTNNAPVANPDTINAAGNGPTTINPLVNDTDIDGDTITLVDIDTPPKHGTAVVNGDSIIYTPDPNSSDGFDTFTYTIQDQYGLTATGTINIRLVRVAFSGTHGGFVKRANGKEVGYFTVTATPLGTFTGIALIEGKRYIVKGTISPDGVYRGWAIDSGGSAIPVFIFTDQMETGSAVTALFANGQWSADLSLSPDDRTKRTEVFGRYTAGIGAGGSGPTNGNEPGTPPGGSGWMALRVHSDATASIKGRFTDGRSFSTPGTVNIEDGVVTLSFYEDPEETRVVGKLTLSDTVGGTVEMDRDSSGEGRFPRGYHVTQTVSGARYVKPPVRRRVLDTDGANASKGAHLTISFEGRGLPGTITRNLFLDDHDNVTVVDRGAEELSMKIDRNSGKFKTKLKIDNEGKRIKPDGVLIQDVTKGPGGRGIGTINTSLDTGTVTISFGTTGGGGGGGGTPTPIPVPVPTPTPTPNPDDPNALLQ